jgi:hypothetical protein
MKGWRSILKLHDAITRDKLKYFDAITRDKLNYFIIHALNHDSPTIHHGVHVRTTAPLTHLTHPLMTISSRLVASRPGSVKGC